MKSDCSIIDSDSDSCYSSNYEEEQDVEYGKEKEDTEHKDRKDNDKEKEHNQHEDHLGNDEANWNEEPMDQDMPMTEDDVTSFKQETRHARRTTLQHRRQALSHSLFAKLMRH